MKKLVKDMLAGDVLSLSRLITRIERDGADVPGVMRELYPHLGKGSILLGRIQRESYARVG